MNFNLHFQLHDEFNRVLMNLIFAEMINCTYGVSIDISAALQHGWKLGRTVCNTTGFLLTLSGKYNKIIIVFPKNKLLIRNHIRKYMIVCFLGMVSIYTLSALAIHR